MLAHSAGCLGKCIAISKLLVCNHNVCKGNTLTQSPSLYNSLMQTLSGETARKTLFFLKHGGFFCHGQTNYSDTLMIQFSQELET